jgi:hypothetical protein
LLTPEDVIRQLNIREARLAAQAAHIDAEIQAYADTLLRLFLLEVEYIRAMIDAELAWVRSIVADLESGAITWNHERMKPSEAPEISESPDTQD